MQSNSGGEEEESLCPTRKREKDQDDLKEDLTF